MTLREDEKAIAGDLSCGPTVALWRVWIGRLAEHPLTDFLRNHKAHITWLKKTRTPEVLTVNGKVELVVQDAESYQQLTERLDHMETIAAIQEGMASAGRGELKPASQVLSEMRAKYGLSR